MADTTTTTTIALPTISSTTVIDKVKNFMDNNFETIKTTILDKIKGLERQFPLLEIIKLLIELVEKDGKKYQLNGEKKQEIVVLVCKKIGDELTKSDISEVRLLADILSNEYSVKQQVSTIFKIHNGELKINLKDGLEDEIEIISTCCFPKNETGGRNFNCLGHIVKSITNKSK